MRDYTKIEAWKMADDLAIESYQVTKRFPKEELYGLTNQLRRSGYSVAGNIAEGSARESLKDYLHFLYIARRPLTETQYFVHLAHRLAYLTENAHLLIAKSIKATFVRLHGRLRRLNVNSESSPVVRSPVVCSRVGRSRVLCTLLNSPWIR